MTYEKDTDLDINSIQEENLKILQDAMNTTVSRNEIQEEQVTLEDTVEKNVLENSDVLREELKVESEDLLASLDTKPVQAEKEEAKTSIDTKNIEEKKSIYKKIILTFSLFFRYILTASFIFVVLMAFTNYSAYITIAKSYLNPEAIEQSEKNIQNSIEHSQITVENEENLDDNREEARAKALQKGEKEIYKSKDIKTILWDIREEEISLDIEIIPFVNRIVIPKIGKNVPMIDIKQWNVDGLDELNDIFMDELEDGIVRYPGSARPWEFGNAFIFGHSSNFPWVAGDYNDVFALLDRLEIGDEVISYYEGQKYTYKITEKQVINPNDVSVLKRETNKKEMTLMTCWPIGTTYNRLLVIGELVN